MTKPTDFQHVRLEGLPINPDVDNIVYRAITYRIARLAHAGRLDPDEATRLQLTIAYVWQALHEGTVGAVRDSGTDEEI